MAYPADPHRLATQSTEPSHAPDSDHASPSSAQSEGNRENALQGRTGQFDLSTVDVINVIAIDPGETTGYAHGKIINGQMLIATGQAKWTHGELWQHLNWYQPHIIVYEKFDFRRSPRAQRDKVNLYAKELIGAIKLYQQTNSGPPILLHEQTAASAMGEKVYFNTKRLKEVGVYKPGKKHSNEAVRHLLRWFTFGKGYKYNKKGFVVAT